MKVLHLTIKKKWFDMIASGEKPEEYRDLKRFWASRFLCKIQVPWGGFMWAWKDITDGDYEFNQWKKGTGGAPVFETFSSVKFVNGGNFHPSHPALSVGFNGIEIREGNPAWGAEPGKKYFVIKLGERIDQ